MPRPAIRTEDVRRRVVAPPIAVADDRQPELLEVSLVRGALLAHPLPLHGRSQRHAARNQHRAHAGSNQPAAPTMQPSGACNSHFKTSGDERDRVPTCRTEESKSIVRLDGLFAKGKADRNAIR